ncbi:MAG: transcription factor S [Nitrososphaerota archaeon]|jgi:DNA-directed RNA polymerase subunit M|nr:transcription factor S [Nitrososphaerota archaeon]MDG7041110.1 transcription factor S [Nitrososphaerota archaeon]MDG7047065.1 transcription factor S [Nitrososphaerota archaeon]MDG7047963.1 transcription factor S [Nitrososphaerota archaeon]
MVRFCPKDGSLLKLKSIKTDDSVMLMYFCQKCGYTEQYDNAQVHEEKQEEPVSQIKVIGEKENVDPLPTIDIVCPKCGNKKAYWWMLQTRSADEPPTQFFKCTKCGYTWRQYS